MGKFVRLKVRAVMPETCCSIIHLPKVLSNSRKNKENKRDELSGLQHSAKHDGTSGRGNRLLFEMSGRLARSGGAG